LINWGSNRMNLEPRTVLQIALKSRNSITIYQVAWLQNCKKKSEMFILNVKMVPLSWTLFTISFRTRFGSKGWEPFQQKKPQIASIMGNVSQLISLATMMHADRYYVPVITHASSSYKSQRRDRTHWRGKGGQKRKREGE
jgi:hypothetical protein